MYRGSLKRYKAGDVASARDMNRRATMIEALGNGLPSSGAGYQINTGVGVFQWWPSRRTVDRFTDVVRCRVIAKSGAEPDWPENIAYDVQTHDGLPIPQASGNPPTDTLQALVPHLGRFVRDGDAKIWPAQIGDDCAIVVQRDEVGEVIAHRLWIWSEKLSIGPCTPDQQQAATMSVMTEGEDGQQLVSAGAPRLSFAQRVLASVAERLRRQELAQRRSENPGIMQEQQSWKFTLDIGVDGDATPPAPVSGFARGGYAARVLDGGGNWLTGAVIFQGSVDGQAWESIKQAKSTTMQLTSNGQLVDGFITQYNWIRVAVDGAASASVDVEVTITATRAPDAV